MPIEPSDRSAAQATDASSGGGVKRTNVFAMAAGLGLFIAASGLTFLPDDVRFNLSYLKLISCLGIGLVLYAIGDEAKIVSPALNVTGATAIGFAIFFVAQRAAEDDDRTYRAETKLFWHSPRPAAEKGRDNPRPKSILIAMSRTRLKGDAEEHPSGRGFIAQYAMKPDQALDFRETPCPFIRVNFSDGSSRQTYFLNSSSIVPSDYSKYFSITLYLDTDKVYASRSSDSIELKKCDPEVKQDVITARTIAVAEAATGSIVAPPVPVETVAPAPRAPVPTRVDPPAATPPPLADAAVSGRLAAPRASHAAGEAALRAAPLGYALFSRFNAARPRRDKSWFEIEGRPDAKFPIPGDVIRVTEDEALLRAYPYRWDAAKRRHALPSNPMATLRRDHKAVVAGDAIIAVDDNNGDRYAIVPVASVQGLTVAPVPEVFPIDAMPADILGYVYLGYIDPSTGDFAEKYFTNTSQPDAIYPAPNDTLTALRSVWLRAGPRRWDAAKKEYVSAAQVKPIDKGQTVRAGGDVVLSKGGTSIWMPVAEITEGVTHVSATGR